MFRPQLNLAGGEAEKEGLYVPRGLHSESRGRELRKELQAVLWEFILFEMQIPPRAERAGETGVQGSVMQQK